MHLKTALIPAARAHPLKPSLPGYAAALEVVGQGHVVGPDVELPLAQPEDAAEDRAAVDADPHVEVDLGRVAHVPDGLYHVEAHLHAAMSVIGPRHRQPADAVVAVAEELYAEAVVLS
jgi:hypothetical protein